MTSWGTVYDLDDGDERIANPNSVFTINDIDLAIPPTQITINKEDMYWQWKTLRSQSSTKVPSGRGVCNVHLTIIFTPDLLLHLHRLIIQFKQSPFCYVENLFLRDSIVPHWPVWQLMAFTMVSLNIVPKTGSPGTFVCELDLRWFNYFPYGKNFYYKHEWMTYPIRGKNPDTKTDEVYYNTIKTLGPSPGSQDASLSVRGKTLHLPKALESAKGMKSYKTVAGPEKDGGMKKTLQRMIATHMGTAFDLQPLPQRMVPSKPALPYASRIYVRYINMLQQDALWTNFHIDIAKLINNDAGSLGDDKKGPLGKPHEEWDRYTNGWHPKDVTLVRGLHKCNQAVRRQVVQQMLKHCGYIRFYYNQYSAVSEHLQVKEAKKAFKESFADDSRTKVAEKMKAELSKRLKQKVLASRYGGKPITSSMTPYPRGGKFLTSSDSSAIVSGKGLLKYNVINPAGNTTEYIKDTFARVSTTKIHPLEIEDPNSPSAATGPVMIPNPDSNAGKLTILDTKWHGETVTIDNLSALEDSIWADEKYLTSYTDDLLKQGKPSIAASAPTVAAEPEMDEYFLYPPMRYAKISSGYGWRDTTTLPSGASEYHRAVDLYCTDTNNGLEATEGVPVFASIGGTIERKTRNGMGIIEIKNADLELGLRYLHLHSFEPTAFDGGRTVEKGQIIGYVGRTGISGGAHLHFEIVDMKGKPEASLFSCDPMEPYHWLEHKGAEPPDATKWQEYKAKQWGGSQTRSADKLTPWEKHELEQILKDLLEDDRKKREDKIKEKFKKDQKGAGEVKLLNEEQDKAASFWFELMLNGWRQYEEDWTVTNVWDRIIAVSLAVSNYNWGPTDNRTGGQLPAALSKKSKYPAAMVFKEEVIVTNVAGGLRHIVASIPLLSEEFPTHQHLGSIEPVYSIELSLVDNLHLEGLPTTGQFLEGMRAELMKNARDFRIIPDSFALVTDHFITRLLGSYTEIDVYRKSQDTDKVMLAKRSCITSMTTETLEGSPATSHMMIELSETNPYSTERIEQVAETSVEGKSLEEKREEVLKALQKRGDLTKGKTDQRDAQIAYLIQATGTILTTREEAEAFISDRDLTDKVNNLQGARDLINKLWDNEGKRKNKRERPIMIGFKDQSYHDEFTRHLLSRMQISEAKITNLPDSADQHYQFKLNLERIRKALEHARGIHLTQPEAEEAALNGPPPISNTTTSDTTLSRGGSHSRGYPREIADASNFYYRHPEFLMIDPLTGAKPLDATKTYYTSLTNALEMVQYLLAEREVSGGLNKKVIKRALYNLASTGDRPLEGKMFTCYLHHLRNTVDTIGTLPLTGWRQNTQKIRDLTGRQVWSEIFKDIDPSIIKKIEAANVNWFSKGWDSLGATIVAWISQVGTLLDHTFLQGERKAFTQKELKKAIENDPSLKVFQNHDLPDRALQAAGVAIQVRNDKGKTVWIPLMPLIKAEWRGDKIKAIDSFLQDRTDDYIDGMLDFSEGIAQEMVNNHLGPIQKLITPIKKGEAWFGEDQPGRINYKASGGGLYGLAPTFDNIAMYLFGTEYYETLDGEDFIASKYSYAYQKLMNTGNPRLPGTLDLWEQNKLRHIRKVLTGLADILLADTFFLKMHGLEHLLGAGSSSLAYGGGEGAYPDLNLPGHPYYLPRHHATAPDFYMWSIYDDAGAGLREHQKEKVKEISRKYIKGSFEFLQSMQKDGVLGKADDRKKRLKSLNQKLTIMQSEDAHVGTQTTPIINDICMHPDAAESTDIAVPGSTWKYLDWSTFTIEEDKDKVKARPEKYHAYISPQYDVVNKAYVPGDTNASAWFSIPHADTFATDTSSTATHKEAFKKLRECHDVMRMPSSRGGGGAVLQGNTFANTLNEIQEWTLGKSSKTMPYLALASLSDLSPQTSTTPRAGKDMYKEQLKMRNEKMDNLESQFGSKAAYLGQLIKKGSDIGRKVKDTSLGRLDHYNHAFDLKTLEGLVQDSSADILCQKISMKRAYPTFKLYFIEEDEANDRFLSFDDFYGFNGVKEFTIHRSRVNAADTAVITLQNIAGTLDGTRRNVVVDLDYFDKNKRKEIAKQLPNAEIDNNTTKKLVSGKDQPFGAIVLRPGMNVQLRAGYADDPNMLETLISGRVTDIAWNKSGDLTEIVVQSFGVELVKRNVPRLPSGSPGFPTTHHLLGSLMLGSNLNHFGRWEKGRAKQIGEEKSHTLDFFDYSDKPGLDLNTLTGFENWTASNHATAALLATGASIAFMFVGGGPLKIAGRGGLGLLKKFGGTTLGSWMVKTVAGLPVAGSVARGTAWAAGRITGWGSRYLLMGSRASSLGSGVMRNVVKEMNRRMPKLGLEFVEETGEFVFKKGLPAGRNPIRTMEALLKTMEKEGLFGLGADFKYLRSYMFKRSGSNAYDGELGRHALETLLKSFGVKKGKVMTKMIETLGGATTATGKPIMKNFDPKVLVDVLTKHLGSKAIGAKALDFKLAMQSVKMAEENALRIASHGWLGGLASAQHLVLGKTLITANAPNKLQLAGRGLGWAAKEAYNIAFARPARMMWLLSPVLITWGLVKGILYDWIADHTKSTMGQTIARTKATYYLDPQDDNLYPPPPTSYMMLWDSSMWEEIKASLERIAHYFGTMGGLFLFGMTPDQITNSAHVDKWWDVFKEPNIKLLEKRLRLKQCEYEPTGQTNIWDIFHEMTLRHPGWIYANRPYGHSFQYRMFYGVPSQRWWSKPVSLGFITRMNDLYLHLNKGSDNPIDETVYKSLYGELELKRLKEDISEYNKGQRKERVLRDRTGMEFDTPVVDRDLKQDMEVQVIREYITGLEVRFVPFRRYHMLTSSEDLVWNGIVSSEHNVVNAVDVRYYDEEKRDTPWLSGSTRLKAHATIEEDMLRTKPVDYRNCKGYTASLRYGMGELIYGMKQMYRGEILSLGNPRIQPWDICTIVDSYNDMTGPVEVEAVTHMFSHETGFLTEIKPNAIVIGNEVSSWPILEGLKITQMAMIEASKLAAGDKLGAQNALDEALKGGFNEGALFNTISIWESYLPFRGKPFDEATQDYFTTRYRKIMTDGFDLSQVFDFGNPEGIPAYRTNGTSTPATVVGTLGTIVAGFLAYGAMRKLGRFSAAFAKTRQGAAKLGTPEITSIKTTADSVKGGFWGRFFRRTILGTAKLGAATAVGRAVGEAATESFTINNLTKGNSIAWFIAAPILFAKCMEQETVIVVPLMKGGRPIVSGLSLKDPMMVWKNVAGQVRNVVLDTVTGTTDYVQEFLNEGLSLWELFNDPKKITPIGENWWHGET